MNFPYIAISRCRRLSYQLNGSTTINKRMSGKKVHISKERATTTTTINRKMCAVHKSSSSYEKSMQLNPN